MSSFFLSMKTSAATALPIHLAFSFSHSQPSILAFSLALWPYLEISVSGFGRHGLLRVTCRVLPLQLAWFQRSKLAPSPRTSCAFVSSVFSEAFVAPDFVVWLSWIDLLSVRKSISPLIHYHHASSAAMEIRFCLWSPALPSFNQQLDLLCWSSLDDWMLPSMWYHDFYLRSYLLDERKMPYRLIPASGEVEVGREA